MKRIFFYLFIFISPTPIFSQVNLKNGLIACYPFNANANDESGNNNNGTINGATLTTDRFGKANRAYNFNGSSLISVSPDQFKNQSYTYATWVKLDNLPPEGDNNYFITVGPDIDLYSSIVPPMLLQPIIENAIRHGLRYKENNDGVLNIDFNKDGNNVVCRINDNGIGIKKSMELKTNTRVEYQSKGMTLTESRINAINVISQKKIAMEVKDKYDEQGVGIGTQVKISFEQ